VHLRAAVLQLRGQEPVETARMAEQVSLPCLDEHLTEGLLGGAFQLAEHSLGHSRFQSGQLADEAALVRPAGHDHLAPKPGQRGGRRAGWRAKSGAHRIE
jgi:hypothetical protein